MTVTGSAMVDVAAFSEDDALTLLREFQRHFGWAVIAFTRQDASTYLLDDADGLSDDDWESVRSAYAWRRFDDWANDGGELLSAALSSKEADAVVARADARVSS